MSRRGYMYRAWTRARTLWRVGRGDPGLRLLVFFLFAIDLAWILWFVVTKSLYYLEITAVPYKKYEPLRITEEGGYPEIFNYLQALAVTLLLVCLVWRYRRLIYVALAAVFGVVLLDDWLAIHESWGGYFVRRFGIPEALGLRAQDFGELITWAILGVIIVPLVIVGLVRADPPHRDNGLAMLVPFAALCFCAIFVDQLFATFGYIFRGASIILDSVEDGGEMLAITFALALAAVLVKHGADAMPGTGEGQPD